MVRQLRQNKAFSSTDLHGLVRTAVLVAACIIVAQIFHLFGLGKAFAPLNLPIAVGALCFGPATGLATGLLAPLLSSLLTGMPTLIPDSPRLMLEMGCLGALCGYFHYNRHWKPIPAILGAVVISRLLLACADTFVFRHFGYPPMPLWANLVHMFTVSLPGVVLLILVVPPFAARLRQSQKDS